MITVNYTTEDKSKAIHNDNYVADIKDAKCKKCNITCWMCIYSGRNKTIQIISDKLLCAKYITEIAGVQGKGTCDSAKSRFVWFNFINPIKRLIAEKSGFDYKSK